MAIVSTTRTKRASTCGTSRTRPNPKFLCHWKTGGIWGVHRFFYNGGRYVHLTAACPGFKGYIYRILDVVDPKNPVEAGRWWIPEQWEAGQMPQPDVPWNSMLDGPNLHGPAYPKGDLCYLSYGGAGLVILDISDISLPKLVGQLHHHPPFAGKLSGARCHTIVPLSDRPYAVMTTEGERYTVYNEKIIAGDAQPLNFIGMVDVRNPADPTLVSTFPYPEIPRRLAVQELHRDAGSGRRSFRAAQHPRAPRSSGPRGPYRPRLLLLLPRRPASVRHKRPVRAPGDRLLHPAPTPTSGRSTMQPEICTRVR